MYPVFNSRYDVAYVRNKINMYAGKQVKLLSVVKRRKLVWYDLATRNVKNNLARDNQRLSKKRRTKTDLDL
jgi:hypothetical protein